mgnify:CR=1 FL=1
MRATGFIWSPLLKHKRRVSNQLIHVTDWLPTIMHVAGLCLLPFSPMLPLSSWSLVNLDGPYNLSLNQEVG